MQATSPRELLIGAFHAALAAVKAEALLPAHLPPPPEGKLIVVAGGKAAADMAACVERHYPPDVSMAGIAITRHGHGKPTRRIRVVEAGHPLPDREGLAAAETALDLVRDARPEDRVLALISGGGSSLLTLPVEELTLADIQATMRGLLLSGAPIAHINCVRKHLSRTLGGRMAQACIASVTALLLSDVAGDDPGVIASGPFAADATTFADALAVLEQWHVVVPTPVLAYLELGNSGAVQDTPKAGHACFARIDSRVIGNGGTALTGAAGYLRARGLDPVVLGDHFSGEARNLAREFAVLARAQTRQQTGTPPRVLLSGGEAQVTVHGRGRGGRNAEFMLALALELNGMAGVHALAADTDGIDGTEDNAGVLLAPDTLARAEALGMNGRACLDDNDGYGFFAALGDLLVTGPTLTNANDFRAILLA